MELTDDQAIELGVRAEALLKSQTFNMVINHLGTEYLDRMLNTEPHEKMVREDAYHHHRALQEVARTLKAFVETKNEVVERLKEHEQEEQEDK